MRSRGIAGPKFAYFAARTQRSRSASDFCTSRRREGWTGCGELATHYISLRGGAGAATWLSIVAVRTPSLSPTRDFQSSDALFAIWSASPPRKLLSSHRSLRPPLRMAVLNSASWTPRNFMNFCKFLEFSFLFFFSKVYYLFAYRSPNQIRYGRSFHVDGPAEFTCLARRSIFCNIFPRIFLWVSSLFQDQRTREKYS